MLEEIAFVLLETISDLLYTAIGVLLVLVYLKLGQYSIISRPVEVLGLLTQSLLELAITSLEIILLE